MNNTKNSFLLFWILPFLFILIFILSFVERKFYLDNFKYNKDEYYQTEIKGKVIFISYNSPNVSYIIKTQSKERVLVTTYQAQTCKISFGNDVLLKCKLKNVNLKNNYSLYLYNTYGVTKLGYVLEVCKNDNTKNIFYRIINKINYFSLKIQKYIIETLQKNLSSPYESILLRLTLGYNKEEVEEIKSYFQDAGVAHVLVVSGLHVGFVYLFVYFLLKFIPLNSQFKTILSLLFVLLYMFLAGAAIPVIRATILIFCLNISTFLKRKSSSLHSLILAAIIILIIFPQSVFSVSFQLSFGACFGIFYFYKRLKNLINFSFNSAFIRYPIELFLITISAQLMLTPLIINYFNKITLVSFISNILVVPFTSLIVWLSFLCYILIFIFQNIPNFIWSVLEILLKFYLKLVEIFAKMPFNALYVPKLNFIKIFLYYMIILLLPIFYNTKRIRYYVVGVILIVAGLVFIEQFSKDNLRVTFFDVGLGDSILVSTDDKKYFLIDTANNDKIIEYNVASFIRKFTNKIDYLIITHPHYPHYAGTKYIIENFKVKNLYISDYIPNYCSEYKDIIELAKHKSINVVFVNSKKIIPFENGAVHILPNRFKNENLDEEILADYNSLVLILEYKEYQVFLPNDNFYFMYKDMLSWFLTNEKNKDKFFVLQLPKHGKCVKELLYFKNFNKAKYIGIISTDNIIFNKNVLNFPVFTTDKFGTIELVFKKYGRINKVKILGYKTSIEI